MRYFEFSNSVKIYNGVGAIGKIGEAPAACGGKSVFLMADSSIKVKGVSDSLKRAITSHKGLAIGALYICGFEELTVDALLEVYGTFRANNCDCIVAYGGDAVVECAKMLELMISAQSKVPEELQGLEWERRGERIPFVAVPSKIGYASEFSRYASVKKSGGEVMRFVSKAMQPDCCVYDPSLMHLPKAEETDALIQCLLSLAAESYTSKKSSHLSGEFCKLAVKELTGEFVDDRDKFNHILSANELICVALSNTGAGMITALSDAVAAVSGMPNPDAYRALSESGLRYNKSAAEAKYAKLFFYAGEERYQDTAPDKRADAFIELVAGSAPRAAGKRSLGAYINPQAAELIVASAYGNVAMLSNPRTASPSDLAAVLKSAMEA